MFSPPKWRVFGSYGLWRHADIVCHKTYADKQFIFLNMSGMIIFCLLSKRRTPLLENLLQWSWISFSVRLQNDLNICPNEIWCQTLQYCRMKAYKCWTIYVDYRK